MSLYTALTNTQTTLMKYLLVSASSLAPASSFFEVTTPTPVLVSRSQIVDQTALLWRAISSYETSMLSALRSPTGRILIIFFMITSQFISTSVFAL
ncbi:hypothetical protein Plhal304r1_c066g0153641 [Plasmopara halstedii]